MKLQPFVITPETYAAPLQVVGTAVTVLAAREATQGYEITYQEGGENTGPPPHSHAWDESFFVLEGTIEFLCDGQRSLCPAGTLVHIPAGTVHGFRYTAGGGRMLELSGPGGQAVAMFQAVNAISTGGEPDVPRLLEALADNGVKVAS